MIGRIESQLTKWAPCEGEPCGLNRILMPDNDNSRVAAGHGFVHSGFVSFHNFGELLFGPSARGVLEVVLQFTREQICDCVPSVSRPMRELSRLCEPFVDQRVERVVSGYRRSGLARTGERRREDQVEGDSSEVDTGAVRLLHPCCREVEPLEIAVYNMIGVEDLTVADKIQVAVQRSTDQSCPILGL